MPNPRSSHSSHESGTSRTGDSAASEPAGQPGDNGVGSTERSVEVAVIGGGPGGACVATLLGQAGREVALFERHAFPRFKVGESLVPSVNLALEKLGVLDQLDALRFPRKHAVQFLSPKGPGRPFYFSETRDPRMHHTWQVLRSDFDALLLDRAAQAGVQTQTETEVLDVCTSGDSVTGIKVRTAQGVEQTVRAKVVVDASGQHGILGRRFGGRAHIAGLENASVFAHYEGVVRDTGLDAGSTLIYRLDGGSWLWFIPLPDTVSIGLVASAREFSSMGGSAAEILDGALARCPLLAERLVSARRTTEVHAVRDYSYRARRDGGAGWILVGDALGFIDPIYSTGLFLTMHSAELAAGCITDALDGRGVETDFAGFSGQYQDAFDQFLVLVQAFYREDFHFGELARNPTHRQGLVDLLTGLVGTPEAVEVTRAIRAFFNEEITVEPVAAAPR